MHAMRTVETVGEDGILHLKVGKPAGTRLEVIVLDLDEDLPNKKTATAKTQEMTGFAQEVLGRPEEDVWNDL